MYYLTAKSKILENFNKIIKIKQNDGWQDNEYTT